MEPDALYVTSKTHIVSTLSTLCKENSFTDVTLVSDDQIPFKAHKFVLSTCSPIIRNLLLDNIHPHPVIFLRGVKQQELQYILQYIYTGEVILNTNCVNQFFEAAKYLDLNEMSKENRGTFRDDDNTKYDSENGNDDEDYAESLSSTDDEIETHLANKLVADENYSSEEDEYENNITNKLDEIETHKGKHVRDETLSNEEDADTLSAGLCEIGTPVETHDSVDNCKNEVDEREYAVSSSNTNYEIETPPGKHFGDT